MNDDSDTDTGNVPVRTVSLTAWEVRALELQKKLAEVERDRDFFDAARIDLVEENERLRAVVEWARTYYKTQFYEAVDWPALGDALADLDAYEASKRSAAARAAHEGSR